MKLRKLAERLARRLRPVVTTPPQTFRYRKPEEDEKGKREIVLLCEIPSMRGSVHVVRKGGEEHLHSHETVDGFWMVLSGHVRFYGDGNRVLGDLHEMEGILLPRNNRYWFESVGEGDAEVLQVLHIDAKRGFQRKNHEKRKFDRQRELKWYDGRLNPEQD
ncbi:MAG: hypothetical protein U5R46_14670 [Gammaproteobacteria bacterium]|nr:hypothetical protein [Gammaproteobacteria bacterium]